MAISKESEVLPMSNEAVVLLLVLLIIIEAKK